MSCLHGLNKTHHPSYHAAAPPPDMDFSCSLVHWPCCIRLHTKKLALSRFYCHEIRGLCFDITLYFVDCEQDKNSLVLYNKNLISALHPTSNVSDIKAKWWGLNQPRERELVLSHCCRYRWKKRKTFVTKLHQSNRKYSMWHGDKKTRLKIHHQTTKKVPIRCKVNHPKHLLSIAMNILWWHFPLIISFNQCKYLIRWHGGNNAG